MNTLEKILNTLAKNLGITVVLVAAIVLFSVFSDGLIAGLITAASALIAYACIVMLYREFTAPKKSTMPATKKPRAKKK